MARQKTGKIPKTINFDGIVLESLKHYCKRIATSESAFVNFIVKRAVLSDKEFHKMMAKYYNGLFQEHRFLMESADDKPADSNKLLK